MKLASPDHGLRLWRCPRSKPQTFEREAQTSAGRIKIPGVRGEAAAILGAALDQSPSRNTPSNLLRGSAGARPEFPAPWQNGRVVVIDRASDLSRAIGSLAFCLCIWGESSIGALLALDRLSIGSISACGLPSPAGPMGRGVDVGVTGSFPTGRHAWIGEGGCGVRPKSLESQVFPPERVVFLPAHPAGRR